METDQQIISLLRIPTPENLAKAAELANNEEVRLFNQIADAGDQLSASVLKHSEQSAANAASATTRAKILLLTVGLFALIRISCHRDNQVYNQTFERNSVYSAESG